MGKRRTNQAIKLVQTDKTPIAPSLYIQWSMVLGCGPTSQLIAWFGGGGYSHVDVVTPQGLYRGARADWVGNIAPGYRDRPANYEKWKRHTLFTLLVSPEQYARYWEFSQRQIGSGYDTRGMLSTFLFGRDWRDERAWWCSEEVAANCEYAGIIRRLPLSVTHVEPGDCALFLTGAGAIWQDQPVA